MPILPGSEPPPTIGGVFAVDDLPPAGTGANTGPSLWDHWTAGARQVLSFRNARSAFAHIVTQLVPLRVWLPAYCCTELRQGAGTQIRFYDCDADLCPNIDALSAALRPRDLVLGVNYFGRPAEVLRPLAQNRPDVIWVEDCAQSVDSAAPPWAPLRIYSPRKVLGVGDGGVLVDQEAWLPPPCQRPAASSTLYHAGLLRRQDTADQRNALWFAAFQRAEAMMDVSDRAMSRHSTQMLHRTPLAAVSANRRRNYARLHAGLSALALWPDPTPDWTPLGFPIRVADAATLSDVLACLRIFAPRHWVQLACNTPHAAEAALSRQLLTLPCDQRYGPADMDRLIAAVMQNTP